MIGFSCPHCSAQLKVEESMAGRSGACPSCSQRVRIPAEGSSSVVLGGSPTLAPSGSDTDPSIPGLAPPRDYAFLAPPEGPGELGRLGPYRVLRVLGKGAMGVVFLAEDSHLKRQVALKVMKPSLAVSDEFRRRFIREAQLAAAVDHEHVVTVFQVGEDRGVPFLAMKLLHGETLEDRLNRTGGKLPMAEVLRVGREVAEGLAAAHAKGLIHRDVKPANIWLEAGRDKVKIVDFGLARGGEEDAHVTQAGSVIGTPAYMAPEQANAAAVDARCDLFSLGVVLYRACTRKLPFGDKDTLSILSALATREPEPPRTIDTSVPRAVSNLVLALLAKDPADRPQTAEEVAEAIAAIERGEDPLAPPSPAVDDVEVVPEDEPEEAASPSVQLKDKAAKKKRSKKTRSASDRKAKQPESGGDWGRVVLIGSLVLLAVALLVLVFAVIRHVTKAHAVAPDSPASLTILAAPPTSLSFHTPRSRSSSFSL